MSGAVSGSQALPGHECNAYCRGSVHAEVFWCDITDEGPGLAYGLLASFCEARGVRCLRVEVAREAKRRGTTAYLWQEDIGRFVESRVNPHESPFLLVFDEGDGGAA